MFLEQGEAIDLLLEGQIESLYTAPRFKAKDAAGAAAWLGVELDPPPTRRVDPASARRTAGFQPGSFPPTRS